MSQGKLTFWRRVGENWNNLKRLKIPLKAGDTLGVALISTTFFTNEEETFVVMNGLKGWL